MKPTKPTKPRFFATPDALRAWFAAHHDSEDELLVGYYKKATGRPSITWEQSVEQALCYGWIDGIRRSVDEASYSIRFTPRRPRSHWSAVNIRLVDKLERQGLMTEAGRAAFARRDPARSEQASYEQQEAELSDKYAAELRANKAAWQYFEQLAPSYRRMSVHWVMSAKREETRRRRLAVLIESCAGGQKVPLLRRS